MRIPLFFSSLDTGFCGHYPTHTHTRARAHAHTIIITMIIARKKGREEIEILLNDKKLEQVKAIKYLGIHFDGRLSFYNHIEQIADKSRALTYMLNRTAKLHWGLGHKSLKTIYEGAIAPLMTYGAPVWGGAITTENASTSYRAPRG